MSPFTCPLVPSVFSIILVSVTFSLRPEWILNRMRKLTSSCLTTVSCYSEWDVKCLSFSCSLIFFFSVFRFSSVSTLVTVSVATESSSFAIHSSLCVYWYKCHSHSVGFLFSGFCVTLSMNGPWSWSMYSVHIDLQEHQAIALMLFRMAFQLSSKVVGLQLDNSTAKAF